MWSVFEVAAKEKEIERIELEAAQIGFWEDSQRAQKTMRRLASLKGDVERWRRLETRVQSTLDLIDLALSEGNETLEEELRAEVEEATSHLEEMEFSATLSGEYDRRGAILAVHAGAGGIDSQDWAQMLVTMYLRWGEAHGYEARLLDWMPGDEAGIKRGHLEILGEHAYGYLKGEAGVHRLIRLSPFDNQHLRHTSFALVEVLPEAEKEMEVTINPNDLRIDVFRSSGAGGQNVQKNETAVRIVHLPTGIQASCQNERSQLRNREVAMRILLARLTEWEREQQEEQQARLRGPHISAEWGNQIRTYVLHPYQMVKDHRTGYEEPDPEAILGGKLDGFLTAYLRAAVGSPS